MSRKIKIENLMLNDWVEVEFVSNVCEKRQMAKDIFLRPQVELNGIQLTDEMLTKNGFAQIDDNTLRLENGQVFIQVHPQELGFYFIVIESRATTDIIHIDIRYVHEFQQILRMFGLGTFADNLKL